MKNSMLLFVLALCLAGHTFAQEKPIRIGVKIGWPNVAGFNAEYVSPLLGGKLAATGDFSYIPFTVEEDKLNFTYYEIGANYYFTKPGNGLYGHLSYGRGVLGGTVYDITYGEGKGKFATSVANLKVGGKWGRSFYFRTEMGYGFELGSSEYEVEYKDPSTGQTRIEQEDVPGFIQGSFLINIGIGVAF